MLWTIAKYALTAGALAACLPQAFASDAPVADEPVHYACPAEVRAVYPDIDATPFINGRGAAIPQDPGMLIDWTRAAFAKSACQPKVKFYRLPVIRGALEINQGRYDILLVASIDNPLAGQLRFPQEGERISQFKMLGRGALMLYTLPDSAAVWDGVKLDLPAPGTVGVVRGQVAQFVAQRNGWQIDESPDIESNFRKLSVHRVSAVLEQQLIASDFIKNQPGEKAQALKVPVQTMDYYSPVTPVFYQRYPEFTEQFWLDMCNQSRNVWKNLPKCSAK